MTQRLGRLDGDINGRQPKAVQVALRVLETVARMGPGVTAKDLAHELELAPATAYRIINLLVGEEYLVRLPDLAGFALGARVANLTGAHAPVLPRAAKAVLSQARSRTRCSVHLAVYPGDRIQMLDADPDNPPAPIDMYLRYPQAVALGKVMLADIEDWRKVLPGRILRSVTDATMTDAGVLEEELDRVRDEGFAMQINELINGRACLALPIRDGQGGLIGGLAASGSTANWEIRIAELKTLLADAADRLSPLMA